MTSNDAERGCGLLVIAGALLLLVVAVLAAFAIQAGLASLTASLL